MGRFLPRRMGGQSVGMEAHGISLMLLKIEERKTKGKKPFPYIRSLFILET